MTKKERRRHNRMRLEMTFSRSILRHMPMAVGMVGAPGEKWRARLAAFRRIWAEARAGNAQVGS